jgi:hypothetical protein
VTVHIRGSIVNYDVEKPYSIRVLEVSPFNNQVMAKIEDEDMVSWKVDYTFETKVNFEPVLEAREDDTVRCMLLPSSSIYIKNPVTKEIFDMVIKEGPRGFVITLDDLKFTIDRDPAKVLDYNLEFVVPTLDIKDDYKSISGSLAPFPSGAKCVVLTDVGENVEKFETFGNSFEITTQNKARFINIYIESRYGWFKHLKQYDIERFGLIFEEE